MNRYLTQDSLPPGAAAPPPEVSEEDMFGAGINHEVTKRFLGFMKPYRRWVIIAISALMIFTLTQILFPLIIQKALDGQLTYFENFDSLELGVLLFAGVVVINFTSHFFSEWMVSGSLSGCSLTCVVACSNTSRKSLSPLWTRRKLDD